MCEYCEQRFSERRRLKVHVSIAHSKTMADPPALTDGTNGVLPEVSQFGDVGFGAESIGQHTLHALPTLTKRPSADLVATTTPEVALMTSGHLAVGHAPSGLDPTSLSFPSSLLTSPGDEVQQLKHFLVKEQQQQQLLLDTQQLPPLTTPSARILFAKPVSTSQ